MTTFTMNDWGTEDVLDSRDINERYEELVHDQESFQQEVEDRRQEYDDGLELAEEGEITEGDLDLLRSNLADAVDDLERWSEENGEELNNLREIVSQGEGCPDWVHGETLILDSYFVDYIEQLINECWELPKEMNSGEWPWRHITIDYDAAAEEAKQDYASIEVGGATYWIRCV